MSTHLININDTSGNWWVPEPIFPLGTITNTITNTNTYTITSKCSIPEIFHNTLDPKLERSYNLARAKNNKSEMRRLEELIANNKQRRHRSL